MHIVKFKSIEIENVRNIGYGEIEVFKEDFPEDVNSIIGIFGPNGTGKSSVIYALKSLRTFTIDSKVDLASPPKPGSITYEILVADQDGYDTITYKIVQYGKFQFKELLKLNGEILYDGYSDRTTALYKNSDREPINTLLNFVLKKLVILDGLSNYVYLDTAIIYPNHLETGYFNLDKLINKETIDEKVLYDLTLYINSIGKITNKILGERLTISACGTKNYIVTLGGVPLIELSFGTRKLLQFLIYFVPAASRSDFCLCIDEIDAGIYQPIIEELLELGNSIAAGQIWFTSHNLGLMNAIPRTSIFIGTPNPVNRFVTYSTDAITRPFEESQILNDVYMAGGFYD